MQLFDHEYDLIDSPERYITVEFARNGEKNTAKDVAVDETSDNVLFPVSSLTGSEEQDLADDLTPEAPSSS